MMKKIILFMILALSLLVIGCGNNATGNAVADTDSYVSIPLSELSDDMQMHKFNAAGTEVRYFTVKGDDGEVRTAFDACDVCGGAKGFRQEGSKIKCNNCGTTYNIDDIGTKNRAGGCWPGYLGHEIKDGNLLIKKADLYNGVNRFA